MAGAEDDSGGELRVNDLSRFEKGSSRLVLEQFDHCEAPAGCIGVVLRWRDPAEGLPLFVRVAAEAEVTAYFDGRPAQRAGVKLAAGDHLLAIHLRLTPEGAGRRVFLCAVELLLPERYGPGDDPLRVLTSAPGWGFQLATTDPGQGWTAPDFAAGGFAPMEGSDLDLESLPREIRYRFTGLEYRRAQKLALPEGVDEVWIRAPFRLERLPGEGADGG